MSAFTMRPGHSKSRLGCAKCKRRRVKCDEAVPCAACARHGWACSLVATVPQLPARSNEADDHVPTTEVAHHATMPGMYSHSRNQSSGDDDRLVKFPWQGPSPHLTPFFMIPKASEPPPPQSWTSDMELMHHYDMSASYTLPGSVEFRHVHQVEYTRLAFHDDALMHQVLAVAAFHLAYLNPSQRHAYWTRGLQHQTEAARGISSRLVHLTPEVSHACFVAGVLLGIGSFASLAVFHDDQDGPKPTLKDLVDIFHVLRGMYAVLKSSEDVIHQGRLAPLFDPRQYSRQPTVRLQQLLDSLHELERHFWRCHLHDPRSSHIVERAILDLIACVEHAVEYAPTPYEWRVVTSWPVVLSHEFLLLLADLDEVALAVTARYCVLLHEAHSVAWFTSGWGRSVLEDIKAMVRRRTTNRAQSCDLLSWPLSRVLG